MRRGCHLGLLAVAVLLDGCAAHRPQASTAQRPAASAPPSQHVYYHPPKAASAVSRQPAVQAAASPKAGESEQIAASPAIPAAIDETRQEDLFRRFDQTRGPEAGADAAAR